MPLGNGQSALVVGRTRWSTADAPVGPLARCKMLTTLFRMRDEGVPRGPGGPPHHFRWLCISGKELCGIGLKPANPGATRTLFAPVLRDTPNLFLCVTHPGDTLYWQTATYSDRGEHTWQTKNPIPSR